PLRVLRRPPRRRAPVPYTTLFRAEREVRAHRRAVGERRARAGVAARLVDERGDLPRAVGQRDRRDREAAHATEPRGGGLAVTTVDRKSTRLNSSHRPTSNAAFCLA